MESATRSKTAEEWFQKLARGRQANPETKVTCRYRRSAVPEVSPWLPSPPETTATCRYRRSAVPEVSPWLTSPPETMATCRYHRSAVPEVSPWLTIPPETMATCRYRRSAVPEVSTGLACLPRDNGDMRRYRRSAVVEGVCRQVTCVTTMSAWMYMDEENFAATQNFY